VRRFPEKRKPRYIPPEEDFWKVYGLANEQDKVMLLCFLHLGARRGEIFTMRWQDIDFRNGLIRLITRKTRDGSARMDHVKMSETLQKALTGWWEKRPFKSSEYVFTMLEDGFSPLHSPGEPFLQRRHFMKRMCERAEVKPFDFHSLRHLSAIILYRDGGQKISRVQKHLRHQRATTTDRYLASLGLDLDDMSEAVEVFSNRGPAKIIPLPKKEKAL
jgi:integrase